jgi:hypothetical protein
VWGLPLHGQQSGNGAAVSSASAATQAAPSAQQVPQEILQELDAMKKRIEQLEAELKRHVAAEQPSSTAVHTPKPPHQRSRPALSQRYPQKPRPHYLRLFMERRKQPSPSLSPIGLG